MFHSIWIKLSDNLSHIKMIRELKYQVWNKLIIIHQSKWTSFTKRSISIIFIKYQTTSIKYTTPLCNYRRRNWLQWARECENHRNLAVSSINIVGRYLLTGQSFSMFPEYLIERSRGISLAFYTQTLFASLMNYVCKLDA